MAVLSSPLKGESFKRAGAHFEPLKASAQDAPNMTVQINAGGYWVNETTYVEYSGGTSPLITAPSSNAKWVFVTLEADGSISLIDGTESASPLQPTVPEDGRLVIAAVYVNVGTTAITNGMMSDIRPLFKVGTYPINHVDVLNRNHTDAHDIASITGLQTELDDRPLELTVTNSLAAKADVGGTPNLAFTLNQDEVGTPSADAYLWIERGTGTNVGIRWNEGSQVWQFTNDGAVWISFDMSANDYYSQTALDGGQLDSRYYTETEIDTALSGKSDTSHNHDSDYISIVGSAVDGNVPLFSAGEVADSGVLLANVALTAAHYTKVESDAIIPAAGAKIDKVVGVSGNIVEFGAGNAVADSGVATSTLAPIDSPVFTGIPVAPTVTISGGLPGSVAGGVLYVSDANGGTGALVYGNGTDWIDVGTNAAVVV